MKLTFKYLDIKGLGEPVRLAMTVGGLPFEDVRLSYDEVRALKATADDITKHAGSPFGQVPVLEIDGVITSFFADTLSDSDRRTLALSPEAGSADQQVVEAFACEAKCNC